MVLSGQPEKSAPAKLERAGNWRANLTRACINAVDEYLHILLLLPAAFLMIVVFIYPVAYAGWLSLHEWTFMTMRNPPFVGVEMFLFPIFWVMMTSLKAPAQVLQMPPAWLFAPQLENYAIVFTTRPFLQALINSTIVTVCSTVLSLITGAAAAYSLARFRLPGTRWVTFSVFLAKMFPPVVLVVPFFVMFRSVGGTDSLLTLIVTYTSFNLPFVIWLLWGFFKELPAGLEEAAAVDGCTRFGAMIRIMLPLARPGLAVAAIFAAMNSWNEFLIAMSLTSGNAGTLPVLASTFVTQEAILWGPITAAATMLMLPIFAFTLAVQKHLVAGLTQGAVK